LPQRILRKATKPKARAKHSPQRTQRRATPWLKTTSKAFTTEDTEVTEKGTRKSKGLHRRDAEGAKKSKDGKRQRQDHSPQRTQRTQRKAKIAKG
jgi:hypothetical protein